MKYMNALLFLLSIFLTLLCIITTMHWAEEKKTIERRYEESVEKLSTAKSMLEEAIEARDEAEAFYIAARDHRAISYSLTESQKELVASVVQAEAGGQGYDGMVLVAECIANAVIIDEYSPEKVIKALGYLSRKEPSKNAYKAVTEVFENGYRTTTKPIMYYYSPANMPNGVSEWHETQEYAFSYEGHRFFCRKSAS